MVELNANKLDDVLMYYAQHHINRSWSEANALRCALNMLGISDVELENAVEKRKSELEYFRVHKDEQDVEVIRFAQLAGYYRI